MIRFMALNRRTFLLLASALGLGLLVWVPLTIASTYVAYRRIYTEDAAGAGPSP